jgi:hypothetical protein
VQQYLADGDPDVDAVYRLILGANCDFEGGDPVVLRSGSNCPFNSQNTAWFPPAFPLMYLPSHASFRMTDIWRSFVAQTCLHHQGYAISFHPATVRQDRNLHSLLHDFEDEIPGYLNNSRLMQLLERTIASTDPSNGIEDGMLACYQALVDHDFLPGAELVLLKMWLDAVRSASGPKTL